jgi:Tol biopolymer transport system component
MNCEHVEELLSAYLDNMLAPDERRLITIHLQSCPTCSEILADYRHNDMLLARQPRVAPPDSLRDHIFSELANDETPDTEEMFDGTGPTRLNLPTKYPRRDTPGRPQLVALPGGRSTQPTPAVRPATPAPLTPTAPQPLPHRKRRGRRTLIATIAAALLLAIGLGSAFGISLLTNHPSSANNGGITPPSDLQPTTPLSAGARFVYLRDGTLWSVASDGSHKSPDRLTPTSVTVASSWVISAPLNGRYAGDRIAYIDLQRGFVHTIRSDGQQDTTIQQPLLRGNISASSWTTDTGTAILSSLAWSPDGSALAFIGDPEGTGHTRLFIYSTDTHTVSAVPTAPPGGVTHPVWSPDNTRLAFEVTNNGITSIIDYNVQNHELLTIAGGIGTGASAGDSVQTLDWSPSLSAPAITWSVGALGQIQSIWLHPVGIGGASGAQLLLAGDETQAIYSRIGHDGVGSWLIVASAQGRAGDILRLDAVEGARPVQLTSGRQVNFAQWSPDGTAIDYLDSLSSGIGTLRVVNATTGLDHLIATGAAVNPAPAWSPDGQSIAFSTGTRIGTASIQNTQSASGGPSIQYLSLSGAASALTWSPTTPDQLIAALSDGQQGIYVIDMQGNQKPLQVDTLGTNSALSWTEIP